jgi:hypothetical protein
MGVAASCSWKTPDHLAVIQPPAASCLTARCRLRVDWLSRCAFAPRCKRSSFFGCLRALPVEPSDTPYANEERSNQAPFSLHRARYHGSTSMLPLSRAPGCLPPGKSTASALAGTCAGAPAPVGRQVQALHVFIDVRKLRLDPCSRRFRGRFVAACASSTSADRCFNEHDNGPPEHPGPAESVGRDGYLDRSLPFDRGQTAEGTQGQGPRITEPRHSSRDYSRKRLRPNPDRFRHLVSRALLAALSKMDKGGGPSRRRCAH